MSNFIDLNQAVTMTTDFRTDMENILDQQYKGLDILAICETFDKGQVKSLLDQTTCVALRVYFGMDENKKIHTILVGVDDDDKDILPYQNETGDFILEEAKRTPPFSVPTSPLNA